MTDPPAAWRAWTEQEREMLRAWCHDGMRSVDMAWRLDRTAGAVIKQIEVLGLRRGETKRNKLAVLER